MARDLKKAKVLELLQRAKEMTIGYEGLKTMVASDNKGMMRSIACLRADGHNIQIQDGFVKLLPGKAPVGANIILTPASKNAVVRRSTIGTDVLADLMKQPASVAELCKKFNASKSKVFTAIHRLREDHNIQMKDSKYIYKSAKSSAGAAEASKEKALPNEIVFSKITQKDLQKVPPSLLEDFSASLLKLVFYYNTVENFIGASQTVNRFMGNSAE